MKLAAMGQVLVLTIMPIILMQWATPIALSVDPSQTSCMLLGYNQQYVFNITFSNSPLDGLQVRTSCGIWVELVRLY